MSLGHWEDYEVKAYSDHIRRVIDMSFWGMDEEDATNGIVEALTSYEKAAKFASDIVVEDAISVFNDIKSRREYWLNCFLPDGKSRCYSTIAKEINEIKVCSIVVCETSYTVIIGSDFSIIPASWCVYGETKAPAVSVDPVEIGERVIEQLEQGDKR